MNDLQDPKEGVLFEIDPDDIPVGMFQFIWESGALITI